VGADDYYSRQLDPEATNTYVVGSYMQSGGIRYRRLSTDRKICDEGEKTSPHGMGHTATRGVEMTSDLLRHGYEYDQESR
jgi:hypothetical protein